MKKWAIALLAVAAGCHSDGPKSITAREFNAPVVANPTSLPREENPLAIVSKPAPIYDQVSIPAPKMPGAVTKASASEPLAAGLPPTIAEALQQPAALKGVPTTRPGESLGLYTTVGGVVAVVNGTPIYAGKVVRAIAPALAASARELNEVQFKYFAYRLIVSQIHDYEGAELEYAAADRTLDESDKKLARNLTVAWRAKLITDSGGSVELARQKVEADGKNFDEVVNEQYRIFLSKLYYEKKISPRIIISATDMRRYYDENVKTMFTEYDRAQFRLIKINPADLGGNAQAITRAKQIRDRAMHGEDFAELAATYNTAGSLLARNRGDVGMIQRGGYALENVEKAVWNLQPGQITDVISEKDGCFYVAKMEVRKDGVVHPFEDELVQQKIFLALHATRLLNLREQNRATLLKDAVISDIDSGGDPHMIDSAVDMAMQRYAMWAGKA